MRSSTDGVATSLEGLYDANALSLLEFQISEIADAQARISDSASNSMVDDAEVAASLLRQNLEAVRDSILDRRMAKSIANAVTLDGTLVVTSVQEEEVTARDREVAQQLQDGRELQPGVPTPPRTHVDDNTLSRLAGLYMSERSGRSFMPLRTLAQETIRSTGATGWQAKRHRCMICGDSKSYFETFKAPCGDEYCRDCLRELFETSYIDETLFPPRCCRQNIPIDGDDIKFFLSKDIRDKY